MSIKLIVMDVDGTLTDGGIYMGENGEVFKRFDVKDGYAIHNILPELGIIPVVITGRQSKIVENRCKELGVKHLIQGCKDKVGAMESLARLLGIDMCEIAYFGDDINDLECMNLVALKGCPCDAADEIKSVCEYICDSKGGYGALREFVKWLLDK